MYDASGRNEWRNFARSASRVLIRNQLHLLSKNDVKETQRILSGLSAYVLEILPDIPAILARCQQSWSLQWQPNLENPPMITNTSFRYATQTHYFQYAEQTVRKQGP